MDAIGYLTIADPITHEMMIGEDTINERLERNLKLSLLLFDKIIIRATALISGSETPLLFLNENKDDNLNILLDKGILIPELRIEKDGNIEDLIKKAGPDYKEIAEKILSLEEVEVKNGQELADIRTIAFFNQIVRALLFQKNHLGWGKWIKYNITIQDIYECFQNHLPLGKVITRDKFKTAINELFISENKGTYLMQGIYFQEGAKTSSDADILWAKEISPSKENLLWNCNYPNELEIEKLPHTERRILNLYGFDEISENYWKLPEQLVANNENYLKRYKIKDNPDERDVRKIFIKMDVYDQLDQLTLEEIVKLRETKQRGDFQKEIKGLNGNQIITKIGIKEETYKKKVERATQLFNASNIGWAAAGISDELFSTSISAYLCGSVILTGLAGLVLSEYSKSAFISFEEAIKKQVSQNQNK